MNRYAWFGVYARNGLAGTSVGNYALFAGGSGNSNVVDAYDTSLTRSTPTALSVARRSLAGASVRAYALFAGGSASGDASNVVDAYDTSLTRSTPTSLSAARENLTGASVGGYALFAGGYASDNASNVIDVYLLIVKAYIPVTQGSKYKFTEGSEQTASTNTTLVYNQKVTGYVKYKKGKITM